MPDYVKQINKIHSGCTCTGRKRTCLIKFTDGRWGWTKTLKAHSEGDLIKLRTASKPPHTYYRNEACECKYIFVYKEIE